MVFFLLKKRFRIINNIIIMSNLNFMVEYHDDYSKDEKDFFEKIKAIDHDKIQNHLHLRKFF